MKRIRRRQTQFELQSAPFARDFTMSLPFVQLRAHRGRRAYTDLSAFCATFHVRLGNENPASCSRRGLHLKSLRSGKEVIALQPQISTWFTEPTFNFHPFHR